MGLELKVKINNVSDLTNARTFAGCGVDYIGFEPQIYNDNGISLDNFRQIRGWVSGPAFVLETQNMALNLALNPELLDQIMKDFKPDFVQISISNLAVCLDIMEHKKIILNLSLIDAKDNKTWQNTNFHALLFDCKNLDALDIIETIKKLNLTNTAFLLDCLPDIGTIKALKNGLPTMGLCLDAIAESKTGFADLEIIVDILDALEE